MSDKIKLYYCLAINKNAYRYSTCGREANKTLRSIRIPDINNIPEWLNEFALSSYSSLNQSLNNKKVKVHIDKWKPFKYEQLFYIERGKGPRKQDLIVGGKRP